MTTTNRSRVLPATRELAELEDSVLRRLGTLDQTIPYPHEARIVRAAAMEQPNPQAYVTGLVKAAQARSTNVFVRSTGRYLTAVIHLGPVVIEAYDYQTTSAGDAWWWQLGAEPEPEYLTPGARHAAWLNEHHAELRAAAGTVAAS